MVASAVPIERACAGLSEGSASRMIAELQGDVESMAPLVEDHGAKSMAHLVGAVVEVRAAPGMTASWLGRVLRCDARRHATLHCSEERCPLVPAGASAEVTATETGFAVAVRSSDRDVAREIERRARVFGGVAPPLTTETASGR